MRRLILLAAVAAFVAIPARSDEWPEDRVSEFTQSVFSGTWAVPIPCDEGLAAHAAGSGLGVSCARSTVDFDGFRNEWEGSLERLAEPLKIEGQLPWNEAGPFRMRIYLLDDLPLAVQFFPSDRYVILTFPGTTMWEAGKRTVADLMRAASGSPPAEPAATEDKTSHPSGPPYVAGAQGVSNPRVLPDSRVPPAYPEQARREGREATVVLQATVLADGTVGDLEVVECTAPEMGFEEAAIAAVRQWRYEPALLEGRPVDVHFTVSVAFDLR